MSKRKDRMNKRELEVRDFLMRRYKAIAPAYASPDNIIVKEDKRNKRFMIQEVWNLKILNKPFHYIRPLIFREENNGQA